MSTALPQVEIIPFTPDLVPAVFNLIEADRDHLNQFNEGTATKYDTLESLRVSTVYPVDPRRERFVIVDAVAGPVGSINATARSARRNEYKIGYWIGGEHTGNGYVKAGLLALMEKLESRQPTKLLTADTHPKNFFSQRALTWAGFELVKVTSEVFSFEKPVRRTY